MKTTPQVFRLDQSNPNPFHKITRIGFSIARVCHVRLLIFNKERKLVRVLLDEPRTTGEHEIFWNGTDHQGKPLPGGFYTYQMDADGFVAARKLEIRSKRGKLKRH